MKIHFYWFVMWLGLGLIGCGGEATDPPTPTILFAPTATADRQSTVTEPALLSVTPVPTLTSEPATAAPSPPTSTLFNVAWDDRAPFRSGLIDSAADVLAELPEATVYHLEIEIQESMETVEGQAEIYYTNQESISLNEIYFHLFPNLLGGAIEISQVEVNGQSVDPAYLSADAVMMRVSLRIPLQPGEAVVISIAFVTHAPQEVDRNYGIFAWLENVLALAHFYPMAAVYDDEGWHTEIPSEIGDVVYADTSFYLVRVTAPADQVLAGAGVIIAREETADSQTLTFAAGPVRDFYLALSHEYVATSQTVGQTTITSYAPAHLAEGSEAAVTYAAAALQIYNERFSDYPFTELDIVSTPTLALGIEYPGIIALTQRMYDFDQDATSGLPNRTLLESTTAHEVAHQWFYSLIGNDQLQEPWLDESLTQYATWLYFQERYGTQGAEGFYQSLVGRWNRVEQSDMPIGLPVAAYDSIAYSGIVYGRGPIFVQELAQTMGQETFDAFLQDYANTYQWNIASTEAFKQLAEQRCDCDLTPLFDAWVYPQN